METMPEEEPEEEVTSLVIEEEEVTDSLREYLDSHVNCVRNKHTAPLGVLLIKQQNLKEKNCCNMGHAKIVLETSMRANVS